LGEECDDGNEFAGDGCSPLCKIEVPLSIATVLIDDEETFILNQRLKGDELPNPLVKVTILTPPLVAMPDRMEFWLDKSRNRTISKSETLVSMGSYSIFSCEVDIKGLAPSLGYNMSLLAIYEQAHVVSVLLFPMKLEIRSASIPILQAMAPLEGPDFGGNYILLGVLNAEAFLHNPEYMFWMRDLDSGIEEEGETFPAVSFSDWGTSASETYQQVMKSTHNLRMASKALVNAYANTVVMSQAATKDSMVGAFLLVRAPPFKVLSNSTVAGILTPGTGSPIQLQFHYEYVRTPQHPATVLSATTALGTASGAMGGGYSIMVSVTDFVMTYDLGDLFITFGDQEGTITVLEQSTSSRTVLMASVPTSQYPGLIDVSIINQRHPQNPAVFQFEYIDDRIPLVVDVVPSTVYSDGGHTVRMTLKRLPPDLTPDEVTITMRELSSDDELGPTFQPQSLQVIELADGSFSTRIVFLTQGLSNVSASALVEAHVVARGKVVACIIDYERVPSGPPVILWLQPSEGLCHDSSQTVSVMLSNIRMVANESNFFVRFGHVTLRGDDEEVTIISSMSETLVSFTLPALGEDEVGPHDITLESSKAVKGSFMCKDPREAKLLYTIPSSAYAQDANVSVTIGVANARDWSLPNLFAHLTNLRCVQPNVLEHFVVFVLFVHVLAALNH
jgi:hypothetical protein